MAPVIKGKQQKSSINYPLNAGTLDVITGEVVKMLPCRNLDICYDQETQGNESNCYLIEIYLLYTNFVAL